MGYKQDTIFAPSTAIGGAIAVIRVSGPEAARVKQVCHRDFTADPGRLMFVRIMDGEESIDDAMAVFFAGPHSYTGEDMVEVNCHGGPQTVQRVLGLMSGLGFRSAEGGEFTRRAFMNGKMDLSQAEAVMDIVTAEAERSRKLALDQLHGSVSRAVHDVEETLLDALSSIDAAIDYPEEVEEDVMDSLPKQLREADAKLRKLISDGRSGRVLRNGVHVVILGRPNAGKSSVMNALVGRDRAIVTDIAGTTRDVLDETVSIDGVSVRLFDTAGIRDTNNEVERIGIDRAMNEIRMADIVLVIYDTSEPGTGQDDELERIGEETGCWILVGNKSDLPAKNIRPGSILISAKTGAGMEELKAEILRRVLPAETENICVTNERHISAMERAHAAVESAEQAAELDCVATDIRTALHELGSITGSDVDADVIDRIFERFCVGK